MSGKTVFISYRRDAAGKAFARLLQQAIKHHGYDVFLDVDNVDAGRWAEQILSEVPRRSHFLLLLTPGALDRCADPTDWVRREFELAVREQRNVVPVREESVDLVAAREACPAGMRTVFDFQIPVVAHGAFERDVEELLERYIPPQKAPKLRSGELDPQPQRVAPSRLSHLADTLVGRDDELRRLDAAWNDPTVHVLTIVAWGGVGKTSLVAAWAANLALRTYDGADYFDWSFFSQGTRDEGSPSGDTFISAALDFFGDPEMARSSVSPWDKGARLAQLVAARRALLVLDGLEPLQYPPGPLGGQLKDPAVGATLKGLAARNRGLCIVTTRETVSDLAALRSTTTPELLLDHLSTSAGVELLRKLGVQGTTAEVERLVADVRGHALTLDLVGRFLHDAHDGDVRRRDLFDFHDADAEIQGGHAFRALAAYEKWFATGSEKGERLLAVLRLIGLFDRPATADCLTALRRPPVIPDLTEPLVGMPESQWNLSVTRLAKIGLVAVALPSVVGPLNSSESPSLEAHPLVREHFGRSLRNDRPEAWRIAHSRLYEHLRDTTADRASPTLDDLQPLLQAVAHGCQAGRLQEAWDKVLVKRVMRGREGYLITKLGALGADLSAVAWFFDERWGRVAASLSDHAQAWMLNEAAFALRTLGRLREAVDPLSAALRMATTQQTWEDASVAAVNLSDVQLALGDIAAAIRESELAVEYASRAENALNAAIVSAVVQARALDQAGRRDEALALFRKAEGTMREAAPEHPLLFSVQGFFFCDLLLDEAEKRAWRQTLAPSAELPADPYPQAILDTISEVESRAASTQGWNDWLHTIALEHLTLGRAALYRAVIVGGELAAHERHEAGGSPKLDAATYLEAAVDYFRRSGFQEHIPRGLLSRAWLRFLRGQLHASHSDLDEAEEIAKRGPMALHQADVQLYRARLFRDRAALAAARRSIERHNYQRRREELANAEEAAKSWPSRSFGAAH